jgi:crotonobetainyl-CoA:carnitine CoA-transferase CaiB-like acyl-CoA transferase
VVAALEAHGVPVAVVRGPDDAVRDERIVRRGETVPLEHPALGKIDELVGSGLPIRYSAARAGYERPAPGLGEHNDFVYGGLLGYDPARLAELRAAGVV